MGCVTSRGGGGPAKPIPAELPDPPTTTTTTTTINGKKGVWSIPTSFTTTTAKQPDSRSNSGGSRSNNSSPNHDGHGEEKSDQETFLEGLAVLDRERLCELKGMVNVRETMHSFIKHSKALIDEVNDCLVNSNLTKTAKTAHALKGASKTIGTPRLSKCSELIEVEAKQGQLESCKYYAEWLTPCLEEIAEEFFSSDFCL